MSEELSEFYKSWGARKRKKKESNLSWSTDKLAKDGIVFDSKNGGAHLIISHNEKIYDFWPSTGKFLDRSSGKYGRGIRNLYKKLGVNL